MSKYIFVVACLFLIGFPSAHASEGEDLVRQGSTVVTTSDVLRSIDAYVPEASRAELLGDERKLRDFVAQLFATKKLAEESHVRGLTEEESWRVSAAAERAAAQAQLAFLLKKEMLADYSKNAYEFYLANPSAFKTAEQVRVQHVLIGASSRTRDEAELRAKEVLALARSGERNFEELVAEFSDDPSATRNKGDMGFFARGRMVKPFEDVAFSMSESGSIEGPVETSFGFHVIRFVDRKPETIIPFENVKEKLVNDEATKHRKALIVKEYERIGKLSGIEVNQAAISALVKPIEFKVSGEESRAQ